MIGGVLTSVVVPLLIKAAKEHRDGGEAYNQRMFTLTVLALGAVTIVATVAGGLLVDLYASQVKGSEHDLMVVFAYFFIPQIFFYGLSSLIGAILNTRNSFAAPMWTPIINNVVVIVVGLLFVVTAGLHRTAGNVSSSSVVLLGVGTTLGIIIQTVALVPSLRRVGFRWRPRFDFRRAELGEIGRMAIWMFGYVVSTQIGFIVTTNVANTASQHVADAGVTAYNYSYALFLLPYAIIGVSVTTALLPRMSKNAAEGRLQQVSDDFSYSIRLSSVILVPAALLLAVLGAPLCEFLFAHGSTSTPDARYIGEAFGAFSLGLVPFVIFQLLLRVFYAMHDSRTPAIIGFLTMIATVIGNFVVLAILPARPGGDRHGLRLRPDQRVQRGDRLAVAEPADRQPGRAGRDPQPGPDARGHDPGPDLRLGDHGHRRGGPAPRPGLRVRRLTGRRRRGSAALRHRGQGAARGRAEPADADGRRPVRSRIPAQPGPMRAYAGCPVTCLARDRPGMCDGDVGS